MDYEYDDSMEYEYTNTPYFTPGVYPNPQQKYVPPPEGTFQVPASFFQTMHSKTTAITNAICEKLNGFSLDDDAKEEIEKPVIESPKLIEKPTVQSPKLPEIKQEKSLVLFSPPLTPQIELPSNNEPMNQPSIPVEQNQIPITPISSPTHTPIHPSINYHSQAFQTPPPRQEPSNIHFYYDFPPPDPLVQSHGTIYYLTGIFKIVSSAILFTGILYISYHIGVNFNHDMRNKIAKYESAMLDEQIFCQHEYTKNKCSPNTRLPAIIELCRNWEKCLHEPISVSKSKVLAETFAEMIDGFLSSLSLKTMFCSIVLVLGFLWSMKGSTVINHHHNSSSKENQQVENSKKIRNKIKPLMFEEKSVI